MITTPALAAAFRLATTLPSRKHERREFVAPAAPYGFTAEKFAQAKEMDKAGVARKEIARTLRCSTTTLFNHLGSVKRPK